MKKTFTLHDLPAEERPRERLLHYGIDALSSQELIALILGRGIQGESVLVTAQKLLAYFGSLQNLQNASLEDLRSIRGIGLAKACQLQACFLLSKRASAVMQDIHSVDGVIHLLQEKIGDRRKEHYAVVSLDSRAKVIGIDTVTIGSLNASVVHPRETFEAAIRRHAASIIIGHNHPSGETQPSDEDIIITQQLMAAGKLFGIPVIDHIIVSQKSYYSFQKSIFPSE